MSPEVMHHVSPGVTCRVTRNGLSCVTRNDDMPPGMTCHVSLELHVVSPGVTCHVSLEVTHVSLTAIVHTSVSDHSNECKC